MSIARMILGRRRIVSTLAVAASAAVAAGAQGVAKPDPKPLTYLGDPVVGRTLFQQQQCGTCHLMAAADALDGDGMGPDLDHVTKTYAQIVTQITDGGHGMSAFKGVLSTAQIQDLALFIYQTSHPK